MRAAGDRGRRTRITSTTALARAIESVFASGHARAVGKSHPATRVFQALRIFVNDELGELACALFAAERVLKPGGRLAVVTFHSLEDRIVKRFLADRSGCGGGSRHMPEVHVLPATFEKSGGVIPASEEEAARNPRARSAKLRSAVRTSAAARAADHAIFGLPKLPNSRLPGER